MNGQCIKLDYPSAAEAVDKPNSWRTIVDSLYVNVAAEGISLQREENTNYCEFVDILRH